MEKNKFPKKCPLASFYFPEGFKPTKENCKVVFDIDKINCVCCFPAHMIIFKGNNYCSCPEVRTDAPHYTNCHIFSEWFWKGKYQNKNNFRKNNKRTPIDSRLRHEVFKRDGYKCVECGKSKEETTLHCDHILPNSQGGTDEMDNLQTLCEDCNLAKSDKKWKGGNDERRT